MTGEVAVRISGDKAIIVGTIRAQDAQGGHKNGHSRGCLGALLSLNY